MSNSNSSRPQFPVDSSSFTTSMHHALESITSRDEEVSAVRPADMEVKSSNLPRGGLYTTWEGAMPANGVKRKPVASSAGNSIADDASFSQTQALGNGSASSTKPLPPTPSNGLEDGNHQNVPLDPDHSPAAALINHPSTGMFGALSDSSNLQPRYSRDNLRKPAPLDPEHSPAQALLDPNYPTATSDAQSRTPTNYSSASRDGGIRQPVPVDLENSPAKALLGDPNYTASSSTPTKYSSASRDGGIRQPVPVDPENSPAKALLDPPNNAIFGTTNATSENQTRTSPNHASQNFETTRQAAPLDPEHSPANALLDPQSRNLSDIAVVDSPTRQEGGSQITPSTIPQHAPFMTSSDMSGSAVPVTGRPTDQATLPAVPVTGRHTDQSTLSPVPSDPTLPAVEPTKYGQAYSDRNPAPNIQQHRLEQEKRHQASEKYFASQNKPDEKKVKIEEPEKGARSGATTDVPIGAEKSNVLFQPTPSVDFNQVFTRLQEDSMKVSYVICASVVILDWLFIGGGIKGLLKSLFPAFGVATAVYFVLQNVGHTASTSNVEPESPKTEKLAYIPESVEWMNSLVETLWHTLQQEFFDGIATTINDTIKPYIPAAVPATVKITTLGHGTQPVRILSMRSLPDSEFGDLVPTHGTDKSGSTVEQKAREEAVEREEGGVFYNLEIAIAYHEAPFKSRKDHMHVDILAMLGPIPFPVFVQVKEFVATVRIRLQMHPDLPFLKNLTFALTENPKVNTCVSIGAPWALDLLNLPIIDNVLVSQIDAAAADFVQPKSMSLDMTVYAGGSDQKLDTDAIGVLFVKIHRARQLARQDSRGPGADPYLTIAFSKYEKPMYATRIIKGDRNPVWEETAIIMIRAEHVKRNENVLLRLWDSDTTGSDDVSGVCEFPLQELILKANQMEKREDKLQGDVAGTDAEGVLEWEIGYFPRAEYQKALRTDAKDPRDHHGDKQEVAEEEKTQDALNTVPDPNLPSGILGLTIHQCINVDVHNPNKKSMGYVKVQDQDSDGEDKGDEERVSIDYIPSLYCTADINDELVYRTRVKNITNSPTFNSLTESYVRDWRLATLTLGVWDTRKKADDCLVGVVSLKISDIFHESSSAVKFYDLQGGEGSGRIRVSMIFRSMQMKLEESLLGYSVGSFVITSPIICEGDINTSRLRLRVSGSQRSIKESEKSGNGLSYTLAHPQNVLPVHHRYLSPLVFEFVSGTSGLAEKIPGAKAMAKKGKHYAVTWLYKLVDNQENEFTVPVYSTDNPDRLIQNVVYESDQNMELKQVGTVRFRGKFKAGIDEVHGEFIESHDQWSSFKSWEAARKSGA